MTLQGGWAPYDGRFWCRTCGRWVDETVVVPSPSGLRCPDCHYRVRLHGRNYRSVRRRKVLGVA